MLNTKSFYALNKKSEGIVFPFNDGTVHVYALKDYLEENPGKTEADFLKLKAWSDEDYRITDIGDCAYAKITVSFENFDRLQHNAVPSREEQIIDHLEHLAYIKRRKVMKRQMKAAIANLTETQRRRYLMYVCEGLSVGAIVKRERNEYPGLAGLTHQSVSESIKSAEKRIKKFLQKHPAK